MQNSNYKKQLVKFDMTKILLLSIKMLIAPIILGAICIFTYFGQINIKFIYILYFILAYIALLFTHELIHAFGYILTGGKIKDIKFGMNLKQGYLYCHCKEPMSADKYMIVLVLPLIITGILPYVLGLILKNLFLTLLGALLISGASGDVLMMTELKKYPKKQLILDHNKAPAYYLCYKEDELPDNFIEVTDEEESNLIKEINEVLHKKNNKKNSKFWKFFILCLILGVVIGFVIAFF